MMTDYTNLSNLYNSQKRLTAYKTSSKKRTDEQKELADVNGDGKINSKDYQLINKEVTAAKKSNPLDLNGDGQSNITDLFLIDDEIDLDGDGVISDDEKSFIAEQKTSLIKSSKYTGEIDGVYYKNGSAYTGNVKNGNTTTKYTKGVLQYSVTDNNTTKTYPNASGQNVRFKNGSKYVTVKLAVGSSAVINSDGTVEVTLKDGTVQKYSSTGSLITAEEKESVSTQITSSTSTTSTIDTTVTKGSDDKYYVNGELANGTYGNIYYKDGKIMSLLGLTLSKSDMTYETPQTILERIKALAQQTLASTYTTIKTTSTYTTIKTIEERLAEIKKQLSSGTTSTTSVTEDTDDVRQLINEQEKIREEELKADAEEELKQIKEKIDKEAEETFKIFDDGNAGIITSISTTSTATTSSTGTTTNETAAEKTVVDKTITDTFKKFDSVSIQTTSATTSTSAELSASQVRNLTLNARAADLAYQAEVTNTKREELSKRTTSSTGTTTDTTNLVSQLRSLGIVSGTGMVALSQLKMYALQIGMYAQKVKNGEIEDTAGYGDGSALTKEMVSKIMTVIRNTTTTTATTSVTEDTDDANAEAEYQRLSELIKAQDDILFMQQKQLETQQKEKENIEKTFKQFS